MTKEQINRLARINMELCDLMSELEEAHETRKAKRLETICGKMYDLVCMAYSERMTENEG